MLKFITIIGESVLRPSYFVFYMIAKIVEELESKEKFLSFRKEHPKAYLAHIFSMHTPKTQPAFQLGYCIANKNQLIVFKVDPIEQLPPDKAFNDNKQIEPLDISVVKTKPSDAENLALSFLSEKFPAETVTKVIMILQRLGQEMYNVTLVTTTFNICNIRIDAKSGKILSHEFKSIMSLRQSED